jgi:outer membrane protein assembly factor BamB
LQLLKNKATTTIVLLLMFAMAVSLVALPAANAQGTKKSYPVIGATPNPVGVGQETLILVGITQQLQVATDGWEGLSVTIERPDGTTETISDIRTDATGMTGRVYRPSEAGTYYLQVHFPAQWYNFSGYDFMGNPVVSNVFYEASDSIKIALNVTDEPIPYYPGHPLPNEYWTRPIDAQNREWAAIAGSWLETTPRNYFAPYNDDAPDTAHILWTTPLTQGGLVGGALDDTGELTEHSFEIGDAYEGKFGGGFFAGGNPLIVAGKLYYQKYAGPDKYKETACLDLHTGEELWSEVLLDNRTVSFAQLMYWDTYDYHGVYDYLWVEIGGGFDWATFSMLPGTMYAFDPMTADWVYTITGPPSGTRVLGPKGEILIYSIDYGVYPSQQTGWMTMWNSSNIPALYASTTYGSMAWGQWEPMGKIVNATGPIIAPTLPPTAAWNASGYEWNVTIPKGLPGRASAFFAEDRVIGISVSTTAVKSWGLNLNSSKGAIGQLLFNEAWNAPSEWAAGTLTVSTGAISNIDKVFTVNAKENRLRYGFSTETGKYLWTISEPLAMLGHLSGGFAGESGAIAYGMLYSGTVSGVIQAFDVTTGELAWTYEARDPYMQVLWSNNWPVEYLFITDGKLYVAHTEHSPIDPRPRGAPFICLNATTGEEIWRINGAFRQTVWGGKAIIGDSIIAAMDTYDQRIYGIGKGPSATTVAVSPKVSVHGSSVLVEGTVTDVSPGTEEYALTARFPNGVPAVCDENMSDWMIYVYKQLPRPADVVGVEVVLSVLDPNTNYYEVGRATSDANGFFSCAFTPEVPGKYTIFATFEGSGAYYGSSAETAINVEEAPAATPAPTPTPAPMTDTYVMGFGIGMIIAIVVVGLLLFLLLRKR